MSKIFFYSIRSNIGALNPDAVVRKKDSDSVIQVHHNIGLDPAYINGGGAL